MAPSLTSIVLIFFLASSLLPTAVSLFSTVFNFSSFTPNTAGINYSGDAYASGDGVIQLTRNQASGDLRASAGHAVYNTPVQLRDPVTNAVADFTTHFEFKIEVLNDTNFGDGLAFFIAPVGYGLLKNSDGGMLGLFNSTTNGSASADLIAVEFDTYMNPWDPDNNHVGINVNSIVSNATMGFVKDERVHLAVVSYNSTTGDLSVYLGDDGEVFINGTSISDLSCKLNLSELLPERVIVGFSGATGNSTELHQIVSWDFSSSLASETEPITTTPKKKKKLKVWVVGVAIGVVSLIAGFFCLSVNWRRKGKKQGKEEAEEDDEIVLDRSMEDKLEKGTGLPKKFTYRELDTATHNFNDDGKLGQGGFGEVYMGVLHGEKVAVKKISRSSRQGKKEFVSEVTVISRLRHRNLVRLIGWCHEQGEFLLVYEFMPNGSLDAHLFGKMPPLGWGARYRIAQGLATALLYLHEEWEQCVVHRDVKASNVMLDSGFNAKLGDFGLARLVDHDLGSQTTVLAGTMGYLAPECVITGKSSKESDVYSFGVVALEIACGRKAVDSKAGEGEVRLVEWVWGLYGMGRAAEAADKKLVGEFERAEVERLVVVGLWCAHPDSKARPTMREAIQVLAFQAVAPSLPSAMPRPMYCTPPMDVKNLWISGSSFGVETGSTAMRSDSSTDQTTTTGSSQGSGISVLKEEKDKGLKNVLKKLSSIYSCASTIGAQL